MGIKAIAAAAITALGAAEAQETPAEMLAKADGEKKALTEQVVAGQVDEAKEEAKMSVEAILAEDLDELKKEVEGFKPEEVIAYVKERLEVLKEELEKLEAEKARLKEEAMKAKGTPEFAGKVAAFKAFGKDKVDPVEIRFDQLDLMKKVAKGIQKDEEIAKNNEILKKEAAALVAAAKE